MSTNYFVNPDWLFAVPSDENSWSALTRRKNLINLGLYDEMSRILRINGKSKAMMLRNLEGSRGMRRVLLIKTMEETAHYVQEAKLLGKTAERMSGFVTRYARIPDTAHDEIPALKR